MSSDSEADVTYSCPICAKEFESKASLTGHKESVHGDNNMSDSDTQTDETDAQSPPIYHHGGHLFTVFSGAEHGESGEQNAYRVDLSPEHQTCTCEHGVHHTASTKACWHIREAIQAGPRRLSPEEGSQRHLYQLTNRVLGLIDELEGGVAETSDDTESPADSSDDEPDVDPQEARETLQSAFDEAMSEGAFDTMVASGKIWINKTPDAPDWTFDAFLSEPDNVWYEPDDAPEDYYKNSILPENVDQYVTEVIE